MERLQYIDCAKGLAIISITLLHFENGIFPPQMNTYIGVYMITMFYVTTGWIDALHDTQRPFKDFLKRRWKQLMVPYIWWTIIILLFDCILWAFHYYDTYFIARETYKSITLRGIGTLWFLPALFGGCMLWYYTRKQNKRYVYLLVLLIILVYLQIYQQTIAIRTDRIGRIIDSPFCAIKAMGNAWIGIAAGHLFYKIFIQIRDKLLNSILFLIGLFIGIGCYFIEMKMNLPPYIWILTAPLLSPLGIILIFKAIVQTKFLKTIISYFTYWGQHSMVLMVTHYSIVMVICGLLNKWITGTDQLNGWDAIGWFALTMIIEYFIVEQTEKRFPRIYGK